jgi:hypothetical protein
MIDYDLLSNVVPFFLQPFNWLLSLFPLPFLSSIFPGTQILPNISEHYTKWNKRLSVLSSHEPEPKGCESALRRRRRCRCVRLDGGTRPPAKGDRRAEGGKLYVEHEGREGAPPPVQRPPYTRDFLIIWLIPMVTFWGRTILLFSRGGYCAMPSNILEKSLRPFFCYFLLPDMLKNVEFSFKLAEKAKEYISKVLHSCFPSKTRKGIKLINFPYPPFFYYKCVGFIYIIPPSIECRKSQKKKKSTRVVNGIEKFILVFFKKN